MAIQGQEGSGIPDYLNLSAYAQTINAQASLANKIELVKPQGHTQTTDAQLNHAQTGPHFHIRSDLHNEDVGLYSRRDELRFRTVDELKDPNPSRERSMERPESSSQIALNMAPNSSRGTSIEKLAGSSSRIANLKLALPKPVSSAPLFDAYSESSRLNDDDDDDIQGTYIRKLGLNSCRRGNLNF